MQRKYKRAKQHFLGERTGDVVTPSDPTAQGFTQVSSFDPLLPSGFDDTLFEKGPGEEKCGERHDLGDVEGRERIPA